MSPFHRFLLFYSIQDSSIIKPLSFDSLDLLRGEEKKEAAMPTIHVNMYEGRSVDQKRKLVVAMTDAVVKSLEIKPEAVQILIHELPKNNVAVAGVLASEKK
jgi:4-oxalocrotonate tautomerase